MHNKKNNFGNKIIYDNKTNNKNNNVDMKKY
jgi:hypothetical protein